MIASLLLDFTLYFFFRLLSFLLISDPFFAYLPFIFLLLNIFSILISKYILRYNYVYFFDILIAKNGPTMMHFVHFYLEMYFAQ